MLGMRAISLWTCLLACQSTRLWVVTNSKFKLEKSFFLAFNSFSGFCEYRSAVLETINLYVKFSDFLSPFFVLEKQNDIEVKKKQKSINKIKKLGPENGQVNTWSRKQKKTKTFTLLFTNVVGLRSGDRLIEVNGVNIESDTHEDVFYRIKACMNVVTLLAVDAKTFSYCQKNDIDVCARKAESNVSEELSRKLSGNYITLLVCNCASPTLIYAYCN